MRSRVLAILVLLTTWPTTASADDRSWWEERREDREERRAEKKIMNKEFSWKDDQSQQVIWYAGDGGVALYTNAKLCVAPPVQAAMTESLTAALKAAQADVDGSLTRSATVVDLNLSDRAQEIRAAGYVLCEANANKDISEAQYAALLETLFKSAFADTASSSESTDSTDSTDSTTTTRPAPDTVPAPGGKD